MAKNPSAEPLWIVYITHARLTSGRAHVLALLKLCEAFQARGEAVEIIAPEYWPAKADDRAPADVHAAVAIRRLFAFDLLRFGVFRRAAFFLQILLFSMTAVVFALWRYRRAWRRVIFFSHDHLPLWFLSFFTDRIFYDIHHFPGQNFIYRRVLRRARGFAVQTRWKIAALGERCGIPAEKIIYWPNGTDVEAFRLNIDGVTARRRFGIGHGGPIVLYAGQLFDWKGVGTLLGAVPLLPEAVRVYVVGGSPEDIAALRNALPEACQERVVFAGFRPHAEMPWWLKAADVLVLPNTGKKPVSRFYTSPMKLFEYMASGKPIVAARIQSLEEVLHDGSAFFAEPDDPHSFAEQIQRALAQGALARERAERARRDVRGYTWQERARRLAEKMYVVF